MQELIEAYKKVVENFVSGKDIDGCYRYNECEITDGNCSKCDFWDWNKGKCIISHTIITRPI